MDLTSKFSLLEDKDTSQAFEALKELEKLSDTSDVLYTYLDKFTEMIDSEKYVIRCRGFRLYCKQARWDYKNKIDASIIRALVILNDDKPTAVRQALASLHDVVHHKKELIEIIREKVTQIDYLRYKDTMHGLISKDIQNLLNEMSN